MTRFGGRAVVVSELRAPTWAPLGGGIAATSSNYVVALAEFDDGSGPVLYAGGFFTTAGGVAATVRPKARRR